MFFSSEEGSGNFIFEKTLVFIIISAVLLTFGVVFYLFFSRVAVQSLKIQSPKGGEEWEVGQTYRIAWEGKGIDKVGIVLFKGTKPKWIAKNVPATVGKYEWKIYPGQEYGDDYWIAVFEYPWQKGNKIVFSDGAFAIVYPKLSSCDIVSIDSQWSYVPSDLPNLRKVFITEKSFSGNLGGLSGADKICQAEAKEKGLRGVWRAFLGGDSNINSAVRRLKRTPRKLSGVYVEAKAAANLVRGANCHRLLGKDFNSFLEKFSNYSIVNKKELSENFFRNLQNVWLGRLNEKSNRNCLGIDKAPFYADRAEKYAFTVTCQNWSAGAKMVEGYPGRSESSLPVCYDSAGKTIKVAALGGLSVGTEGAGDSQFFVFNQGKYCDEKQKLVCIEE